MLYFHIFFCSSWLGLRNFELNSRETFEANPSMGTRRVNSPYPLLNHEYLKPHAYTHPVFPFKYSKNKYHKGPFIKDVRTEQRLSTLKIACQRTYEKKPLRAHNV